MAAATAGRPGNPSMPLVYYSIADFGDPRYERQWCQSIRSLRAHNARVAVHLLLYNEASASIMREAERQHVTVHRVGSYRRRLQELAPQHGHALSRYPIFHKMLSLQFLPAGNAAQILYLDCDTFFFGDVMALFRKYRSHDFYAREEPFSRRSHYGYRSSYLNEDSLAETCAAEGLAFIPPYNAGIFMLNRRTWRALAGARREFLLYAWRLLLGISENAQLARECNPALLDGVRRSSKRANTQTPLPYPSSNWWILDEIAMLLTLAGIPGLTHGTLRRKDAAQNGEFQDARAPRPTLVHYYSVLEEQFFERVKRL